MLGDAGARAAMITTRHELFALRQQRSICVAASNRLRLPNASSE
jgi:hypothetical protein